MENTGALRVGFGVSPTISSGNFQTIFEQEVAPNSESLREQEVSPAGEVNKAPRILKFHPNLHSLCFLVLRKLPPLNFYNFSLKIHP
jgi:hypothetical protein